MNTILSKFQPLPVFATQGLCESFEHKTFLSESLLAVYQPPMWRITHCHLSATAYQYLRSYPPYLEAVSPKVLRHDFVNFMLHEPIPTTSPWTGQPGFDSWQGQGFFATASRPALNRSSLRGAKVVGAWNWALISIHTKRCDPSAYLGASGFNSRFGYRPVCPDWGFLLFSSAFQANIGIVPQ